MISIKSGTQTWSTAEQQSSLKGDKAETLTAAEREKHYGGANLQEILNKAADPNWVDPSTTRQVGGDEMGKDAFLKLFLAQLKNQDPTSPMESTDMAAQLAQFTSLEKLENIDKGIGSIVKTNETQKKDSFDTLQLIGKGIAGDSSKIFRSDMKDTHEISFSLTSDANDAKIEILNSNNDVVKTLNISKLKAGKNKLDWNGLTEDGLKAPEGEYRVSIEARASNGKKLMAETRFNGVVTGVNYTAQGPVLMLGRKMVKLSEVKKIFEPGQVKQAPTHQLKVNEQQKAKKTNSNHQVNNNQQQSKMSEVGMSRELVNKLTKETGQSHGIN